MVAAGIVVTLPRPQIFADNEDAFSIEKLRTIDRITFRTIKPFEIRFGPFDTRIF
jgi:hypothetical protein